MSTVTVKKLLAAPSSDAKQYPRVDRSYNPSCVNLDLQVCRRTRTIPRTEPNIPVRVDGFCGVTTASSGLYFTPRSAAHRVVIFFPGTDHVPYEKIGGSWNAHILTKDLKEVLQQGHGCLMVGYQSNLLVGPAPSEKSFAEDAAQAIEYVKAKGIAPARIISYGFCLGTFAAMTAGAYASLSYGSINRVFVRGAYAEYNDLTTGFWTLGKRERHNFKIADAARALVKSNTPVVQLVLKNDRMTTLGIQERFSDLNGSNLLSVNVSANHCTPFTNLSALLVGDLRQRVKLSVGIEPPRSCFDSGCTKERTLLGKDHIEMQEISVRVIGNAQFQIEPV